MKQYTIQTGKQNFKPCEPIWPKHYPSGFRFRAVLDASCWWSKEDWKGDKDRNDWNKLCGMTGAFSRNNRRTAYIAWRPADIENTFLVTAYTNDKKGGFMWGWQGEANRYLNAITVKANEEFTGACTMFKKNGQNYLSYELLRPKYPNHPLVIEHPFDPSWHRFYRQVGTWMGGADNSPGPYGGGAHKKMKLWLDFKWVP